MHMHTQSTETNPYWRAWFPLIVLLLLSSIIVGCATNTTPMPQEQAGISSEDTDSTEEMDAADESNASDTSDAAEESDDTAPPAEADEPETETTLRFAMSSSEGTDATLDPVLPAGAGIRYNAIYDQLVELDASYTPQPMLAESWEHNDVADEWTFHLREDVVFHDGTPMTAEDVVFTYQRILDPETGSPGRALLSSLNPDGIEAIDDYTVRFMLDTPVIELPVILNNRYTWIVQASQDEEERRIQAIGTGPFKVEEFTPGEDPTILVRNEDYWREGRPRIDVLEIRSIPEPFARLTALEQGQVDMIEDVPPTDVQKVEENPDLQLLSSQTGSWGGIVMMVDQEPFDDVRVRQAFKYVVDREQMLDLVALGQGNVANDNPVAPWIRYAVQDEPRQQNIDKAKELLAEAGYADGLSVELHTSSKHPYWIEIATVFKEMAAQAGIDIRVVMAAPDSYWSEVWMQVPLCMTNWGERATDNALSVMFLSDAEFNETHWYNPEWDSLVLEARQTVDEEKRTQRYQEAQRVIIDEGGVIIPFFENNLVGARANVTGYTPSTRKTLFYDFSTVTFTDE